MAKNTIATRITLEGGQTVAADLKTLGATGERAFNQIRTAADRMISVGATVSAAVARISTELRKAADSATNFAHKVEAVGTSIGTVAKRVGVLSAAIAAAGGAFVAFNANAGASAEAIQNQASAVGLSAGELQKFSFAAKTVGLDSDRFTQVMSVLIDQLEQTSKATDDSATALGRFGVSSGQAAALLENPGEALKFLASQFAAMTDGSAKSGAAIDIFGRRIGAKLIPFLNLGADGLNRMGTEAVRLGASVSDATLDKLAAFDDSLDVLKATAKGAQLSIAAIFAPSLTQGANALTELLAQQQGRLEEFAQSLVTRVVPIIKDIINAITGHDADVSAPWVLKIRDDIVSLAEAAQHAFVDIIIPAFNAVTAAADKVAQVINGIFGTEFTGQELLVAAAILSLTGGLGVLASVIGVVVAAFGVLGSTVGLVVAAVVLVGLDIVLFSKLLAQIDWAGIGTSIVSAIVGAFRAIGSAIAGALAAIGSAVKGALAAIGGAIKGALADAISFVKGLFSDLADYIANSWVGRVVAAVRNAIAAIQSARAAADGAAASGAAAGARIGGHHAGGQAGRPGRRGPRDRVLAWFDPDEFVVRADAVRQVGAAALNFINQRGELPGFAMGGLVAAAGGGRSSAILSPIVDRQGNGGARNVLNLSIDGHTFENLIMDDDTAASLGRYASGKKMTSGGRKPAWYQG